MPAWVAPKESRILTDTKIVPVALATTGFAVLFVLVGAPLVGWPGVVRLPAVLVPALALVFLITTPWRWHGADVRALEWQPSRRQIWSAAAIVGLSLFWYVLTRFRSGEINAIDFTIYFDRPCFQTVHGRPLFVEVSDTPGFSNRSEFSDHAYWAMLPVCTLYAIVPSPMWLHAISATSIVAGAFHVLRILQHLGVGGALASATAFAFILNDNTARALNYGFHPEVLYAWLVPWMIDAGLRVARRPFAVAMLACVLVKEDALLPIFAVSVALAFHRLRAMTWADARLFLVLPPALAFANVFVYFEYVVPMLTGTSGPNYAHYWANWGDTPAQALLGMLGHPWQVAASVLTSGISRVLMPFLFLPLVAWRWVLGIVPIVAIYGASANGQLRDFGIYYAIVIVPFLAIAASVGALTAARRYILNEGRAQLVAGVVVVLGAVLVESWHRGYSLRPWKAEVAALPGALAALSGERLVLVQSGLFPHAGYDQRFKLLTPETLSDPDNAGVELVLAPRLGAYPFKKTDVADLARRGAEGATANANANGLVTVRAPDPAELIVGQAPPSSTNSDAAKKPDRPQPNPWSDPEAAAALD